MDWIKTVIYTTRQGIDVVCDKLYDLSYTGVQIDDEEEFNEFLENNQKYWDYVDEELRRNMAGETKITLYIEDDQTTPEKLLAIKSMLEGLKRADSEKVFGRLEVKTENVCDNDWANNWKKYFKPTEVGEKILIVPQWEEIPEGAGRVVFRVNPGLTFGTGTHGSTQLCIKELEKVVSEKTSVLDLGCGSGILSIISLMLGASSAVAVDIDENCIHTAYDNARMNDVDLSFYKVYAGDVLSDKELIEKISDKKYEVVVANIVADVIIALLPAVKSFVAPGGTFICSGIIHERLEDVTSAMNSENIEISAINKEGEWASVTCKF